MIIIDFNQTMIAAITSEAHGQYEHLVIDMDTVRHKALNMIRSYRVKFPAYADEIVIATDTKDSWRKLFFEYYKANRALKRKESPLDWGEIFRCITQMKEELKQFFPYTVIDVYGAEGDDIIGALCHNFGTDNGGLILPHDKKILILSSDGDFGSLHKYENVRQFNPIQKKEVKVGDPYKYLREHIIRGDTGDGVPNILSPDNVLVTEGIRQKKITEKVLNQFEEWIVSDNIPEEHQKNYLRNKTLIDLSMTPSHVSKEISKQYVEQQGKSRQHMFNYFVKNKLTLLLNEIQDF